MSKQPAGQASTAKRARPGANKRGAASAQTKVDDLLKLYRSPAGKGASPEMTDALTQALVVSLGSGPSVAGLESMMSSAQAFGLMFHGAVAEQQRANIEALAVTANCVKMILAGSAPASDPAPETKSSDRT